MRTFKYGASGMLPGAPGTADEDVDEKDESKRVMHEPNTEWIVRLRGWSMPGYWEGRPLGKRSTADALENKLCSSVSRDGIRMVGSIYFMAGYSYAVAGSR